MTKERFCKIINSLKEAHDIQEQVNEIYRNSKENLKWDFANAASLQISHESIVIELLKEIMHDEGEDIGYFIYELDYGKEWTPSSIACNGESIDISTPEKLFDYLAQGMDGSAE